MNTGDLCVWNRHGVTIPARILMPGKDGALIQFADGWTCIPTASGRCSTLARQWFAPAGELQVVDAARKQEAAA